MLSVLSSIEGGSDLDNYVIFNEELYSPIEGKIVVVVDK